MALLKQTFALSLFAGLVCAAPTAAARGFLGRGHDPSRNGRRWARKRMFRGNDPQDLRAALGSRGGWLVWDGSPGNAGSHTIRIAAVPGPPRR